MGIRVHIKILDVDTQLASFDQIQVFRSVNGPGGPFTEITSATEAAATLTGTETGPFTINNLYLDFKINKGVVQRVTFVGTDPVSATDVASQITAQISGLTAADSAGAIVLTSDDVGVDAVLEVVGGTALAVLGFTQGQLDTGEGARIPLVEGTTQYMFYDPLGVAENFYKYQLYNSSTTATGTLSAPVQGNFDAPPKQQADTKAPRGLTLIRGQQHTFRVSFFEGTTALVPLDSSKYPSFQIIDINGQIIQSGLATLDGSAGNYRVEFSVPKDAHCSNDDRRWRVEFFMITDQNRQVSHVVEFDVRDEHVSVGKEVRDQKLLAFPAKKLKLVIRLNSRPSEISLDVFPSGQPDCLIVEQAKFPLSVGSPEIVEVQDCEQFAYVYTIPAGEDVLKAGMTYTALWEVEENLGSVPEQLITIIDVVHPSVLPFFPSLRMVIDKFQKKRGIRQAYTDSDIYEYLRKGLSILNGWHPLTGYTIYNVPEVLCAHWMIASSIYGLNAQHLLETDLQFGFGGQTVTLDYDHTANLDAAISRSWQWLQDTLTQAKTPLFRRSQSTGVMAGKPYRYNSLHNFTFKLSQGNSSDFIGLLSQIGLL